MTLRRMSSSLDDELIVTLADGRAMSAPLVWFPRVLRTQARTTLGSGNRLGRAKAFIGQISTRT